MLTLLSSPLCVHVLKCHTVLIRYAKLVCIPIKNKIYSRNKEETQAPRCDGQRQAWADRKQSPPMLSHCFHIAARNMFPHLCTSWLRHSHPVYSVHRLDHSLPSSLCYLDQLSPSLGCVMTTAPSLVSPAPYPSCPVCSSNQCQRDLFNMQLGPYPFPVQGLLCPLTWYTRLLMCTAGLSHLASACLSVPQTLKWAPVPGPLHLLRASPRYPYDSFSSCCHLLKEMFPGSSLKIATFLSPAVSVPVLVCYFLL